MSEEKLVKIYVELPSNEDVGAESFWAEDLGKELYRLRNVPFHAFGLNFYDIVRAVADSDESKPEIVNIEQYSGHKTLRVIFTDDSSEAERVSLLKRLNEYKAYHENANGVLFAIDVEPEGDYGAVCDMLYGWEKREILSYETCEARNEGKFDAG